MIASIAEKPTRHYKSVKYEWDQIDRELYKMFPYLKGVSTVQITKNIDDKALFDLTNSNEHCFQRTRKIGVGFIGCQ